MSKNLRWKFLTIVAVAANPVRGTYDIGRTITITLTGSETMIVTGTPVLTLNDGGTATYASGSGTTDLVFTTTIAPGQNAATLAVTGVTLPSGATIRDGVDNDADLTGLFRLRDTASEADEPDVEGTWTPSGGSSTVTRQVLDGHVYGFQVRARNTWSYNGVPGSMDSAPTAWCWFAVDTTP